MAAAVTVQSKPTLEPTLEAAAPYTHAQFKLLASHYPDLQMERTAGGELIIMPPAGGETGRRNFDIAMQLGLWSRQNGTGLGFDSSTGFILPNGAIRSPDASWILRSRWDTLSPKERDDYLPLCPDFVIELRSRTDRLSTVQKKMLEYLENGAHLGWLIDPQNKRVEIYRAGQPIEILQNVVTVSGESVLPGFVLDLQQIFGT